MIKCPKCGKEFETEVKFCDECGTPVQTPPPSAPTQQTPPQNNNIKNGCLGCGGLIAIIIAIIFLISMCTSSKNSEPPEHNTNSYVLYLGDKAKKDAKNSTPEDLQEAVDWFRVHRHAFCGGSEIMEQTMYYGLLLAEKYKGTENEYEKIGSLAYIAVSQVYTDGINALRDDKVKTQIDSLNILAENITDIIPKPTPTPFIPSAEKLIEPSQHGTTEYADYLFYKAANDSLTATDEQIQEAVTFLKTNINSYFDTQENMEKTMYYGKLIARKYHNSGNDYEKAGNQAYRTVAYVYRGIDKTTDETTLKNLKKLQDMTAELPNLK